MGYLNNFRFISAFYVVVDDDILRRFACDYFLNETAFNDDYNFV